jgi:hypothetical protein
MAKATCPVTRAEFLEKATPITVSVGGTPVDVQIGLNMTVAGSKDLPKKRK